MVEYNIVEGRIEPKRFTTKYSNHYALEVDFYDNGERITISEVIDLLNNLHEENQHLKNDNKYLKERNKECRLYEIRRINQGICNGGVNR